MEKVGTSLGAELVTTDEPVVTDNLMALEAGTNTFVGATRLLLSQTPTFSLFQCTN